MSFQRNSLTPLAEHGEFVLCLYETDDYSGEVEKRGYFEDSRLRDGQFILSVNGRVNTLLRVMSVEGGTLTKFLSGW